MPQPFAPIGPYRPVAELGRGGMGIVYRAHDPSLSRFVAVKKLAGSLVHDDDLRERFLREARSMAGVSHPHVVSVYSIGQDNDCPYIVMELIDGESLSTLLKRRDRPTTADAARIVHQAALGLAAVHAKGIVHRDIKPGNLMVSRKGEVKVTDFGIARNMEGGGRRLTMTGEFVGTPGYLSPELCTGEQATARSDVFSLGMVLYECLTGRVPFSDKSPLALMLNVVNADLPDVRQINQDVDPQLAQILARMVAKNPADRFANGAAVAEALGKHPSVVGGQKVTLKVRPAAMRELSQDTPRAFEGREPQPTVVRGRKSDWSYPPEPEPKRQRSLWPWIALLAVAIAAFLHFHGT